MLLVALAATLAVPGGIERANLEKFATELGADLTRFKKALDERTHQAKIEADTKAGNAAGINGTPGFIVKSRTWEDYSIGRELVRPVRHGAVEREMVQHDELRADGLERVDEGHALRGGRGAEGG